MPSTRKEWDLSPARPSPNRERPRTFLCGLSKPRIENLSLLIFGLFAAGNCQMPRIAAQLPLSTGAAGLTQRLRRLLMNPAIKPITQYQPVAPYLLSCVEVTCPSRASACRACPDRFHIEEMFHDFKELGFRLETTHLRDPARVSRLLLCICLAHVWLMNAGVWVSKQGLRRPETGGSVLAQTQDGYDKHQKRRRRSGLRRTLRIRVPRVAELSS